MDELGHFSNEDDYMEGYASESERAEFMNVSILEEHDIVHGRSIQFSAEEANTIVMHVGKRFHNNLVFCHVVKAFVQRVGFKLCRLENNSTCISYECSDIGCDWRIKGRKLRSGPKFNPKHNCRWKHLNVRRTSR